MAVRRGQDRPVLYDTDAVAQAIVTQRTYFDETTPQITTPITPLFLVRQALAQALLDAGNLPPIGIPAANTRQASVCFANSDNVSGETNFTVVLPWHPLTAGLVAHLREIKEVPGVLSITYQGEM